MTLRELIKKENDENNRDFDIKYSLHSEKLGISVIDFRKYMFPVPRTYTIIEKDGAMVARIADNIDHTARSYTVNMLYFISLKGELVDEGGESHLFRRADLLQIYDEHPEYRLNIENDSLVLFNYIRSLDDHKSTKAKSRKLIKMLTTKYRKLIDA